MIPDLAQQELYSIIADTPCITMLWLLTSFYEGAMRALPKPVRLQPPLIPAGISEYARWLQPPDWQPPPTTDSAAEHATLGTEAPLTARPRVDAAS